MSPCNHSVPFAKSQKHVINPTNPRGALDDGVEDRLHVRRRAADDAEHLGRCRLMLQGLAQLCVALLQFLEQANVLNGDYCLGGKRLDEFNLPLRKGFHNIPPDCNGSDRCYFAKQGNRQGGACTGRPARAAIIGVRLCVKSRKCCPSRNARLVKLPGSGRMG